MIDTIFIGISQAVLLILLSYFYILAITRLLPEKWLRPVFPASKHDMGIKKNIFAGGRSIAYEPRLAFRKYMSGYVLYCEGEKKYIKCKIAADIKEIKYSVTIFARNNRAIGTLDISEKTDGSGYTQTVNLPTATSFVQINILSVDGKELEKSVVSYYNFKGIVSYAVTTVIYTIVMALFYIWPIHDFLNQFIQDYFYYSDDIPNLAVALLFGLCFGVINTGIVLLLNLSGNAKIIKPKE